MANWILACNFKSCNKAFFSENFGLGSKKWSPDVKADRSKITKNIGTGRLAISFIFYKKYLQKLK